MKTKNKEYWCPRCGKMYVRRSAWLKHVNDKKCVIARKEYRKNKSH